MLIIILTVTNIMGLEAKCPNLKLFYSITPELATFHLVRVKLPCMVKFTINFFLNLQLKREIIIPIQIWWQKSEKKRYYSWNSKLCDHHLEFIGGIDLKFGYGSQNKPTTTQIE